MESLAKAGLSRLKGAPLPWLLIYDNAHDPSVLADWLPPSGVHILITTRWSDRHGVAGEVDLGVFSPEVSQDYLLQRANSKDRLGAARLAATLEFLPLALDQAGALCKRTGLSFDDYGRRISELIRLKPAASSYAQSVFGTFSVAIDDAAANCPDAERLFGLLAFLAPDIPLSIMGAATMDVVDRTRAIEALNAASLVAIRDNHVRVHRLVQEVMRQRVHEMRAFPLLRNSIYEMLKGALTGPYCPAWESALCAVHYDPSENASLQVEYAHNAYIDVELTLTKRSDGILYIARAMDGGRPFHRIETLYYLDGGWKSRELSNRMF